MSIKDYLNTIEYGDWHAIISIQLGELIEGGLFDWEKDDSLKWDYYNEEQYKRVCNKFVNRYYYREIGIIPYKEWKQAYIRRLNELMPKYKMLYQALENGVDPLQNNGEYGKSRNIYSDFPQTQLNGINQDYATNGNDEEYERITTGDFLEKARAIKDNYDDIDVMLLDELEPLFSQLFSVAINGF